MSYSEPSYSLRYDKKGREKEMNSISPLLTAGEFSINDVDEELRPQYQIMREAIDISRKWHYDLDLYYLSPMLVITVYKKFSEDGDLPRLMRLFGRADLAGIYNHKLGRSVILEAFFWFAHPKHEE